MAGGTGHMLEVKRGRDYCYHFLTDKVADVVLLFFGVLYSFFAG